MVDDVDEEQQSLLRPTEQPSAPIDTHQASNDTKDDESSTKSNSNQPQTDDKPESPSKMTSNTGDDWLNIYDNDLQKKIARTK